MSGGTRRTASDNTKEKSTSGDKESEERGQRKKAREKREIIRKSTSITFIRTELEVVFNICTSGHL